MKIALITNIPAPYRLPIYSILDEEKGFDIIIIFCAKSEPNRMWNSPELSFKHIFLKEKKIFKRVDEHRTNFIHNNIDVLYQLHKIKPDVVINTGYNPTNIYGWLYALFFYKKHIVMTDGTFKSEQCLSFIHRLIRKTIFKFTNAFIGASNGSIELFTSYKISSTNIFKSCLCIKNSIFFNNKDFEDRDYDIMFSGQFINGKLPMFFADVAIELSKIKNDLKVLIIGSGPMKTRLIEKLEINKINFHYPGFISQSELPKYYSSSKVFLFPTLNDPWGVVANEALASGTPVITTLYAGVSDDLIINGKTGFILEVDIDIWVEKVCNLLQDKHMWKLISNEGIKQVSNYNFTDAADGIIQAVKHVTTKN